MKRLLALSLMLALGGCISLLPEPPPPPRIFVLEAGSVAPAEGVRIEAVAGVALPAGERVILGADLLWRTGDQLAYVAQTQWSARADMALQAMLVETLVAQGRFRAAVRADEARTDVELRWDVRDFEVDEAAMIARFVADAALIDTRSRRVIAATRAQAQAPVTDRSSTAAADALARAAREGSARIGVFAADAAAQTSAASISR